MFILKGPLWRVLGYFPNMYAALSKLRKIPSVQMYILIAIPLPPGQGTSPPPVALIARPVQTALLALIDGGHRLFLNWPE